MHDFVFDAKLACEVTIRAPDPGTAEKALERIIEAIDRVANVELGRSDPSFVSLDLYMDDVAGPIVVSVDGDDL